MTAASNTSAIALELAAIPDSLPEARRAVGDFAAAHDADVAGVKLAVTEAVGNAVLHGFGEDASGRIWVRAVREHDALVIAVEDDGTGIRPRIDSPGLGLGIPIIESTCDALTISDRPGGGARLVMRFGLPA